jgi:hypothetical protein
MSELQKLIETEAKARGITVEKLRAEIDDWLAARMKDRGLFRDLAQDFRSGLPTSASMLPRPSAAAPVKKGSGWVEPPPLGPQPGIATIDAMCIADDIRQRQVTINTRAYELQRQIERELAQRDKDLDPFNTGIYNDPDKQ